MTFASDRNRLSEVRGEIAATGLGPLPVGKLSVAMISHYLPSGSKIGAGYQAHYMADALVRHGHRVTMFSLCRPTDGALYQTVTVPAGRSWRTFRFAWNLRRVDFSQFDVVHAHGDDYWLWRLGRHVNKPPHVRTMHGSCFAEARHIPGAADKLRMAVLGLSEALATAVADRTISVSRNTTRYYPWARDVIVNGVDLAAFRPGGEADKERSPTILFVGTYHNRKRGRLLMEAFRDAVRPAVPDARLWMVCESAPAPPGVTVFGRVSLDELASLYRRAWVFCLPSSYEGFGVPYIEAMASGTPVVATPNVGAVEVLEGGRYGVIAGPARLGTALAHLLTDPAERRRLADAGLRRAQSYSWDQVVRQYEQVYASVRGRGRSPARPASPLPAAVCVTDGSAA